MVTPFAQGALLRAAPQAQPMDARMLAGGGDVLVLSPHPDDESLGCGAAIAAAGRNGAKVTVACLTDGSRSHPRSASHPPARLAALRLQEMTEAVAILTNGTGEVIAFGYPDQQAPSREDEISRAAERVCALVERLRPAALWTTWEGDPHVDHKSAARIASRVAKAYPGLALFFYPVWGRFTETALTAGQQLHRFDTTGLGDLKERAVLAHRSQMTGLIDDDPGGFVMAEETRRHFVESPELFIGTPAMTDRAVRFDQLYAHDPDPWNFRTSPYEREKYAATLAALPRPRYRTGVEAGCSIGELTWLLAGRCDRILGIDISAVALEKARARNTDVGNVSFLRMEFPSHWPAVEADLVMLSEVLYFLKAPEIHLLADKVASRWAAGGDCLLVNYLGETSETLQGAEAADIFIRALTHRTHAIPLGRHTGEGYRIDILRNSGGERGLRSG